MERNKKNRNGQTNQIGTELCPEGLGRPAQTMKNTDNNAIGVNKRTEPGQGSQIFSCPGAGKTDLADLYAETEK